MSHKRRWYCSCEGTLRELIVDQLVEDELLEPSCPLCGATPSSDPKHTISYTDEEDYSD